VNGCGERVPIWAIKIWICDPINDDTIRDRDGEDRAGRWHIWSHFQRIHGIKRDFTGRSKLPAVVAAVRGTRPTHDSNGLRIGSDCLKGHCVEGGWIHENEEIEISGYNVDFIVGLVWLWTIRISKIDVEVVGIR